ncbi:MAG: hypothetical protein ACRC10_05835 [Thermoguttaceae bacterium]
MDHGFMGIDSTTLSPVGRYQAIDSTCCYKSVTLRSDGTCRVAFQDTCLFDIEGNWWSSDDPSVGPFVFYDLIFMEGESFGRDKVPFDVVDVGSQKHLDIALPDKTHLLLKEQAGYFASHYPDGKAICIGDLFFDGRMLSTITGMIDAEQHSSGSAEMVTLIKESGYLFGFTFENTNGVYVYNETREEVLIKRGNSLVSAHK